MQTLKKLFCMVKIENSFRKIGQKQIKTGGSHSLKFFIKKKKAKKQKTVVVVLSWTLILGLLLIGPDRVTETPFSYFTKRRANLERES